MFGGIGTWPRFTTSATPSAPQVAIFGWRAPPGSERIAAETEPGPRSTLPSRMVLRHRCPRSCATSSSAIWIVESYVEVSPGFSATPVTSSGSWCSAAKLGPFVHVVWADAWPRAPRITTATSTRSSRLGTNSPAQSWVRNSGKT